MCECLTCVHDFEIISFGSLTTVCTVSRKQPNWRVYRKLYNVSYGVFTRSPNAINVPTGTLSRENKQQGLSYKQTVISMKNAPIFRLYPGTCLADGISLKIEDGEG